jgi:hypothetical protein
VGTERAEVRIPVVAVRHEEERFDIGRVRACGEARCRAMAGGIVVNGDVEAAQRLNSAFDLDVYSWLAHRLCRVNDPAGVLVSWAALKGQFGQEYADTKNFRRRFLGALKNATGAYRDARIETVKGGLRLLPSPPPVKRKMLALPATSSAVAEPVASLPSPAPGRLGLHDLVSEKALEQVPGIAPAWDKHHLAATHIEYVNADLRGERPRHRDAAFLGWVRKIHQRRTAVVRIFLTRHSTALPSVAQPRNGECRQDHRGLPQRQTGIRADAFCVGAAQPIIGAIDGFALAPAYTDQPYTDVPNAQRSAILDSDCLGIGPGVIP